MVHMEKNNRDATNSIKGYYHQLHETIMLILDDKVTEIKLEGIEDIDLYYNDQKVLVQVKYHKKK